MTPPHTSSSTHRHPPVSLYRYYMMEESFLCQHVEVREGREDTLGLEGCREGEEQQWFITHYNPGGMEHRDLA